ncbi:type ISP restriction/modification enzyme [Massilia phyllosphaerae]|uniref:type ISP restriction/modification enzyme n=1 Tax=Massilia phyllosphaerae TaxID=3106034 RepID=UPI002B1CD953|nr:type ISP restriction/modification enzyme [Massilia sp. SGZ-792]
MTIIENFIERVIAIYKTGIATEHSYRPAIEALFNALPGNMRAVNEPKRVACGAPDFIVHRGDLVVGHLEAKDIGISTRGMKDANKNQQERYLKALPNLIYTNCLDWDFYRNGQLIGSVTIADYLLGIQPKPETYEKLENWLTEFANVKPQRITSPQILADKMAGKAQLIKTVLFNALMADGDTETEISNQYEAFKMHLIHDISKEDFSDIYAETIAYGMFAARLHDTSLDTFSRQEALTLLPKSNPFLRSLFTYLAGYDLDNRIAWIIDDLATIFQAADVGKIMEGFGKLGGRRDPFIHFYETFLAEYNPKKRTARGVWYTPEAVVNFIVRAADDIIKRDFKLADGLADTSKSKITWDVGQTNKKGKTVSIEKEVHRVQILDPATGTGTFLSEIVKVIAPRIQDVAPSMWSSYVEEHLVPRLHGFELLMASYAMCHMKLDMMLTEMGYKPTNAAPRLSVYLTNSLEEGDPANQTLPFAQWLSNEVKQANTIKRDMPIMCVVGNPPYSSSSSNKSPWINNLIAPYKENLAESSKNALSDDYVKFLRLAESFVEKNNFGIVAMITNNSFVDGIVHRKMREHLRTTFNKIYIINLHGDSNKKERAPDGGIDANVFDIKQGVAITVAVKTEKSDDLADVFVKDIWGTRAFKYDWLSSNTIASIDFSPANLQGDYHFFTNRPFAEDSNYKSGFSLLELFVEGRSGIKFRKDKLLLTNHFTEQDAIQMVDDVLNLADNALLKKYKFNETSDWQIREQRDNFSPAVAKDIVKIAYRPFDFRYAYYPLAKINKIIPRGDSRAGLMKHMIGRKNVALLSGRQNKSGNVDHFLVVDCPSEMKAAENTVQSYHFPLYIYPSEDDFDSHPTVNFKPEIYAKLQKLGSDNTQGVPDELAVFDYVYGVLYSHTYRQENAEFLRVDFARIPWPSSSQEFWRYSLNGKKLRQLHLMEPDAVGATPFPLMGEGDNVIDRALFCDDKVWINAKQYFSNVSTIAWECCIGGYQPAQKWLKVRKGKKLTYSDAKTYQSVIKVLTETSKLMSPKDA